MGFTTGFLGGFTLTSSVLYLTVVLHQRNRLQQSLALRQSSLALGNIVEPQPTFVPPSARERHAGLTETAKDRWNSEVERFVKKAYEVDWSEVRDNAEARATSIWRRIVESSNKKD